MSHACVAEQQLSMPHLVPICEFPNALFESPSGATCSHQMLLAEALQTLPMPSPPNWMQSQMHVAPFGDFNRALSMLRAQSA